MTIRQAGRCWRASRIISRSNSGRARSALAVRLANFNSGASAQSVGELRNFPTHGDSFGPAVQRDLRRRRSFGGAERGDGCRARGELFPGASRVLIPTLPTGRTLPSPTKMAAQVSSSTALLFGSVCKADAAQVHPGTELSTAWALQGTTR
jgi:hypothetical protein